MTNMVDVQFCFEDHEHMAEGAEHLKTFLHSWNIVFENMDDLNEYFTFKLSDNEQLETHIRAMMDVTRMAYREVLLEFGHSSDGSRIGIRSERFEECITRALDWCRCCGDYEISIVG